jgi:hypothetical protein
MQVIPSIISRIEHIVFDLNRAINDLQSLKNELSMMDIKSIDENLKALRDIVQEKNQRQPH